MKHVAQHRRTLCYYHAWSEVQQWLPSQYGNCWTISDGAVIPVSLQADFLKMNGRDRVFLKMIITLNNDEIISSFWLAVMWGCSQCYSFDNNLLLYLMNSLKLRNSWIQTKNGSKSFFSPSYTRLRSQLLLTLHPLLKLGTQTNDECTEAEPRLNSEKSLTCKCT